MHQQGRTMARYVVPAIGGLCVTYLYNIVDGIFVGQGVGAAALGAVNIGVPFITFVVAAAAMFPMGGATAVAIAMGRGDRTGANRAFQTALTLTVLLSLLLMGVGMGLAPQVVALSGGAELSPAMEGMAVDYLFYYTAFSVPLLLSNCLAIFVRNDGAPTLSFVGMCAGAAANIFLDWLFIFPLQWGIVGAAVASGLGQVLACAILLSHFLRRRGALRLRLVRPAGTLARRLCLRGLPEALSQLTTPVTALCYNWMLAWLVGDLGVSTFSVLSFLFSLANAVFSGVAQGLQPLWGQCHGQGKPEEGRGYFRRGMGLNLALAAGIVVLLARPGGPAVQPGGRPGGGGVPGPAPVCPLVFAYGGQPHLHCLLLLHPVHGPGQSPGPVPGGGAQVPGHLPAPLGPGDPEHLAGPLRGGTGYPGAGLGHGQGAGEEGLTRERNGAETRKKGFPQRGSLLLWCGSETEPGITAG